jgi:hypothetical protein
LVGVEPDESRQPSWEGLEMVRSRTVRGLVVAVLVALAVVSCGGSGSRTPRTAPPGATSSARLVSCAKPAEVITSTATIELGSCDGTYGIYPEGGIIVSAGEAIRVKARLAGAALPPMRSSDETVLHPLSGDAKADVEFRAERAGTADVLARTSACHGADWQPTNPCVVTHVVVARSGGG